MRKKLIVYVVIFFILQFIKSILIADYEADYGKSRIEMLVRAPATIEYKKIRNSNRYDEYQPILIKQMQESIADIDKPVKLVGTTYNYGQLEHLPMVRGAFFTNKAVMEGRNVAVISDKLSMQLFGSTKAVGNILDLNQKAYKVVGVYKKYNRLRDYINDDDYEHIYIPITCEALKEAKVEAAIIDGTFLKQMPDEGILGEMGLNSNLLIMNDQSKWVKESKSIGETPFIIFHFVLSLMVGKLLYQAIKEYRHCEKIETKKQYVMIGAWEISLLVCGIYLYCAFKMSFSNVYINANRLPKENIFDLQFYWQLLCQDWAKNNLFMISGIAPFRKMLSLLRESLHGINILQYILLAKMVQQVSGYIKLGKIKESSQNTEKNSRGLSRKRVEV